MDFDKLPLIGQPITIPPASDLILLGKKRLPRGAELLVRDPLGNHHTVTITDDVADDGESVLKVHWEEAKAPPHIHAYCYASGQIEFGAEIPAGALPVCHGPEPLVRAEVRVTARHAYEGETLLVPGVPEAESQEDALDALRRWCEWAGAGERNEDVIWAWSGNDDPEEPETQEAVNG